MATVVRSPKTRDLGNPGLLLAKSWRRRRVPRVFRWQEDFENSLIEGDCIEVMKKLPDACVDLVLCDLPYGSTQNPWDSIIPLVPLWEQYRRVIKPRGVIALTGTGAFTAQLIVSAIDLFRYKIVWHKSKPTNFLNAKKQPLRKHEDICVFYKKQPKYFPQMGTGVAYDKGVRKDQLTGCYGDFIPVHVKSAGERYPTDVVYFKTAESEGAVVHPTQKPVALGRYLVRTFTEPGDLVLDNAFGSGSFLLAAAIEDRRFVGIELNEQVELFKQSRQDCLDVASWRLSDAMIEGRVFARSRPAARRHAQHGSGYYSVAGP